MRRGEMDIHIDRISLPAMPSGGERRLREAVARALAGLGEHRRAAAPAAALAHAEGAATGIANQVEACLPARKRGA